MGPSVIGESRTYSPVCFVCCVRVGKLRKRSKTNLSQTLHLSYNICGSPGKIKNIILPEFIRLVWQVVIVREGGRNDN